MNVVLLHVVNSEENGIRISVVEAVSCSDDDLSTEVNASAEVFSKRYNRLESYTNTTEVVFIEKAKF